MIYTPRSAHVIPVQRPLRRRLFRALNIFIQLTVILSLGFQGGFGAFVPTAQAANPSANLDQCANDPSPSPSTDGCATNANEWVNGNLGASKSVYFEGDSIPYRMKFENLSLASHTVTIEWDTTKSSKHAIDYLTSFDRTVATADPCLGVSGCGASTTFSIPSDPQVTGAGVTPVAGNFTLYGGTITSASAYSYPDGAGFVGDKSASITLTFTASVANPVLAWGGHISHRSDWGTENSAVAIPGSPYHTRLIDLDGSGGNQDRSLSAEAVIFPASITVVKQATPEGSQSFGYTTTGGLSPASFSLVDDGTPTNTELFSSITDFTTYTVSETTVPGWTLSFNDPVCTVTTANGGSQNADTDTVTIDLEEGENVSCTFKNDRQAATVTVIKHVINDNGGTAVAGDFTMHVSGTNVSDPSFPGSASGTIVTVDPGSYAVTEDAVYGYTGSLSADCTGTVAAGENKTCTVTNNDVQPKLTVTKVVVNDDGGTAVVSDFPLFVGATGVTSGVQNGFNAAAYVVSETPQSGYTATISGDCDAQGNITLAVGDVKSCTITNDDLPAHLTVIKHVVNVGDSEGTADQFTLHVDGSNPSPDTFAGDESGTVVTLDAGGYSVSEDPVEGWTTTFDQGCEGTLPNGGSATCTVTNTRDAGRIEGTKFDDQNGDSVWDDGEPGVPGVTIHLSNGDQTVTDDDGNYAFDPVPTGTYTVSEDVPAGWTATTPETVTDVVVEKDGEAVVNFGNFHNVTVTACKVEDADGNIETANDQTPIPGWTVHLSVDGDTEDTQATGENGCYTWTDLGPGVSYDVSEDTAEGWTALGPTSNDFGPAVSGAEYTHTFANFQNGSISGRKFDDVDQNGEWDEGEPTIAGWTIFLSNGEGSVSTPTGQDGTYAFSNVGPGSYTVYEDVQVGWVQTYPDFTTYTFDPLLSGTESADNDFGNFHLGRISGFKFNDLDGDGTWDEGESGLDGWTICLNGIENCVVTGTDDWPDGYYEFTGLTAGSYDVYESQQDGWVPTTPTEIEGIVVQSGTDSADNNFGNFRTIELSGQKFNDRDQNGVKDEGDTGLSGWTIQLWEWNGEGFDLVGTQITDGSGNYAFTNLGPGTYRLREVGQDGWTQTTPDPSDVTTFSGTDVSGVDFGNFQYGRISGYKYDNDTEDPLNGWEICLTGGTLEAPWCVTTGDPEKEWPTGYYEFTGLSYGEYAVTETVQGGWAPVDPASGTHGGIVIESGSDLNRDFWNRRIFPDLSVTKTDGLTTATPGQTTTYSITIHNGGEYQAEHVWAVDTLPAHTSFVSASDSGTFSAGQVTWADLGTLAVGADKVVTVTVALDALFPFGTTNLHNVVTVATTTEEPNTDNNGAFDDTSVSASPVLGLTKTADPTAVPAGTNVNWTVHWSVSGDSLATAVVITDPIPANSTFVSVADGGTYDAIPNTLTWNLGTKNPGDSGDVHFVTRVASPLANGTVIHNVASIDSAETDPAISAFADAVVISAPTLTIQKTDSPDPVAAGANLTYTLQWSVGGNAPATNVVITDPLPANTTFVSADNGGSYNAGTNAVTWNLGNKNLPEVGTVSFIVKVANPLPNGTVLTNTATIDSDETPPVSSTTTTTVASAPVLTIAKVNNGSPFVNPGAVVTYTVTVSNTAAATDTAHTVKFTDVLPSGFTYVNGGGSTQTFTLGELAPGASVATSYQATVSSNQTAGLHTNTATASADNHPAISATSVVDVRVPQVLGVTALPTLEISKTADVPFAGPDTTVNYTVTVKNVGDATAVNVVLHDTLPKGFTFTSGGRDKDWNLGNLEPGTARVINYPVYVSPTVKAGKYTNVATAQADNADQVSAKHTLPVKVARVLGLATTGPSALDYVLLTAGALLLLLGTLGLRRPRREQA